MYLIALNFDYNSIEVIRNVPDDLEEDDIDDFVINKLHRYPNNDIYMLADEDSALIYSTYDSNNELSPIKEDAVDYFGQHF